MVIKYKKAEKKTVALCECSFLHSSYTANSAIAHTESPTILFYPC